MGYQALLFCSDDKTARLVTQVLTELDFSVEPSNEPFAAVKRLTTQHFDAIIVDCDNEQNAALLFKSARNSGPNRASLAVAVVEGQPGIAKAFRIGANLVLTKPINVEQSKGTLRVARGLLKKPDSARPSIPTPQVAEPAAPPARPPAISPVVARPLTPIPPAKPVFTPPPKPPQDHPAMAMLELEQEPAPLPEPEDAAMLESMPDPVELTAPASIAPQVSPWQPVKGGRPFAANSSAGEAAGVAPAPIRETLHPGAPPLARPAPSIALPISDPAVRRSDENTSRPAARRPVAPAREVPVAAPTFSIPQEQESGGGKKIFLIIVLVALAAVGAYLGWGKFQPKPSPPPVSAPVRPKPAEISANPSRPTPAVQRGPDETEVSPAPQTTTAPAQDSPEDIVLSTSPKESSPAKSQAASPLEKPAHADIVVKSSAPGRTLTEATPQAPPMIAMSEDTNDKAISGIVDSGTVTTRPVLQTLTLSAGVSQGLLIKKIQPVFPSQARQLRIAGTVQLVATVGKDGKVANIKTLGGHPMLVRAASDAIKQWKYKPYLLNGHPVEFETQITINFKLP